MFLFKRMEVVTKKDDQAMRKFSSHQVKSSCGMCP